MRDTRITDRLGLALGLGALLLAGCSHESADWKQAGVANSTEAYQLFLQQHPHSAEAGQAQARIKQLEEQRDWQVAGAADTRDAYEQFVAQHPDSKWVQEARIRIENFAQAGVTGGAALSSAGAGAGAGTGAGAPAGSPTPAQTSGAAGAAPGTAAPRSGPVSPTTTTRLVSKTPKSGPTSLRKRASRASAAALARAHNGGPMVQLGAFRSKARAESEWRLLSARFSTLKSLRPRYVMVRSRAGQIYRLQVRMSSVAAANGLCATLKRHTRACARVNT